MVDYLNPPPEMLDRPIEPWHPQIGNRVRVVLNGECRIRSHPECHEFARGLVGHMAEEHGRIGVVVEPEPMLSEDVAWFSAQGHPYLVWYDESFEVAEYTVICDFYAAIELEPLDDLPAPITVPQEVLDALPY